MDEEVREYSLRRRPRAWRYLMAAWLAALTASYAGVSVVGTAWATCDVGINAAANSYALLLFQLPVLVLVHAAALTSGYVAAQRWFASGLARFGATLSVTVLAISLVSWIYCAIAGLPLQNALCPSGEPRWWPEWLPPPPAAMP